MNAPIRPMASQRVSQSAADRVARGLGWFSIGLGLAEIVAPRKLRELAGLNTAPWLLRAYGVRELATGIAILQSHDPEPWLWGRVGGDAVDIATAAASRPQGRSGEMTLGALAGVAMIDALCALALQGEKGINRTAAVDYRDRSGFPGGVANARGLASARPALLS